MEYFLDNFQLRKLQLLNVLDSEERFFSINELAEQMQVSNPTVDKTIEAAKNDCQTYRLPLTFERCDIPVRSIALKRHFRKDSHVLSLRKIYIMNSLSYQLLYDFFFEHFSDVKTFAQEQFTSHSLIYNKLNQLKEMLAQFNLTLDLGQQFNLVGNERQIRYLFVSLFWNTYNDFDWPFASNKKQFDDLLNEIESLLQTQLSPMHREYYRLWLGVCLARIEKGYLPSPNIIPELNLIVHQHHLVANLKKQFKQLLPKQIDEQAFNQEFSFLLLIIYSFDIRDFYQRKSTNPHLAIIYQLTRGKLEFQTQLFLHNIFNSLKNTITVQDFDHFYLNLLNTQLKYSFFSGSPGKFHKKETRSFKPIQQFFYDYVKKNFNATQPVSLFNEPLVENSLFLEETARLLYIGLQKRGYLPEINFLLLWPDKNNQLASDIAKQLPLYRTCCHNDLSQCQRFDLVIAFDFYQDMSNVTYKKIIYINRVYGKKDLMIIQQAAEEVYLEKLKTLFNTEHEQIEPC